LPIGGQNPTPTNALLFKKQQQKQQALAQNTTLQHLSLRCNDIGAAGCRALAAALRSNRTLRTIDFLPGNRAPVTEVEALARALNKNKRGHLRRLMMRLFGIGGRKVN
jgi:Ran GTPase-activating protein (RanGAP) involved in mRNA processing and transport